MYESSQLKESLINFATFKKCQSSLIAFTKQNRSWYLFRQYCGKYCSIKSLYNWLSDII